MSVVEGEKLPCLPGFGGNNVTLTRQMERGWAIIPGRCQVLEVDILEEVRVFGVGALECGWAVGAASRTACDAFLSPVLRHQPCSNDFSSDASENCYVDHNHWMDPDIQVLCVEKLVAHVEIPFIPWPPAVLFASESVPVDVLIKSPRYRYCSLLASSSGSFSCSACYSRLGRKPPVFSQFVAIQRHQQPPLQRILLKIYSTLHALL
jgi:hypothetical protein